MPERRLAAILAADMVGYSRLMATDEAGTLARLKSLRREIIEPAITGAGGEIVKLTGDGMLVLFGSVVAAVETAAAVQNAVAAAEASSPPERRIAFRIGLHLGDVMLDDGDIYGDGVNIAARLEGAADPGGVTLSDDAFRQVRGKTGLRFIDLGDLALKNLPHPVRAHKLDLADRDENAFEALTGQKPAIPEKPSVAVMPFDNMSADPEQAYFADGITEDIITELSRFSGLLVIARNSTFSYKGRAVDLREVSRDLGVRFIVEGSVRRVGDRVRVTAQLIDATTGSHLWAERYDRDLAGIFDVQEEITRNIVASVAPQIEIAETDRARRRDDADASAYDLALRADAIAEDALRLGSHETIIRAIALADQALARDPHCVLAYISKASAEFYTYLYRWGDAPDAALANALATIDRLFDKGINDPRAYARRGIARHFRGDRDDGLADLKRAVDLNPNYALGLFLLAWAESLDGLADEAFEHATLGLRLSPREIESNLGVAYLALAQASFARGDFAETRRWGRQSIQLHPRAPIRRALMIASCGFDGDLDEATEHRAFLESFAPGFLPSLLSGGVRLYRAPEINARLVEGLRTAGVTA